MAKKTFPRFVINGRSFSSVNTLDRDGTVGQYKKTKTGIYLYVEGELVGYCCDRHHFTGLVTAYHFEGRIRYMYGATDKLAKLVGFDELKYSSRTESVKEAIHNFNCSQEVIC